MRLQLHAMMRIQLDCCACRLGMRCYEQATTAGRLRGTSERQKPQSLQSPPEQYPPCYHRTCAEEFLRSGGLRAGLVGDTIHDAVGEDDTIDGLGKTPIVDQVGEPCLRRPQRTDQYPQTTRVAYRYFFLGRLRPKLSLASMMNLRRVVIRSPRRRGREASRARRGRALWRF